MRKKIEATRSRIKFGIWLYERWPEDGPVGNLARFYVGWLSRTNKKPEDFPTVGSVRRMAESIKQNGQAFIDLDEAAYRYDLETAILSLDR